MILKLLCCRFNNSQEIVVQILESNYEVASDPIEATKICDYCNTKLPETQYKEHLISTHSELLFHCDECDSYVDRKDFIVHMSQHAVEYATERDENETISKEKDIEKISIKDTNENTESEIPRHVMPETELNKTREDDIDIEKYTCDNDAILEDNQDNDFSDHSDAEYFCELPKSVFEAIEDSQDTQGENIEQTSQNDTSESLDDRSKTNDENLTQSPILAKKSEGKKVKKERTCPICFKVYTVSSSYFYHLKYSHKNNREHECDVCGKKFSAKPTLAQHLLIHTGDCPYECRQCGKKFRARASLYIHEQTHVGVKAHSCSECHKSFRWRAHLERHRKRHEARKSHVCATCGRGFSVRCDLLRHARTHAAGAYECAHCGLKFAQSRYMKTHIIKKHST